jgi:hypothetical protein
MKSPLGRPFVCAAQGFGAPLKPSIACEGERFLCVVWGVGGKPAGDAMAGTISGVADSRSRWGFGMRLLADIRDQRAPLRVG